MQINDNKRLEMIRDAANSQHRKTKRTESTHVTRTKIRNAMPDIVDMIIAKALEDKDLTAAKMLLERAIPVVKPVGDVVIVDVNKGDKTTTIGRAVLDAMTQGDITPDHGKIIFDVLMGFEKLMESSELSAQIKELNKFVGLDDLR